VTARGRLAAILLVALALRLWVAAHVSVIAGDGITRIGIARTFLQQGIPAGLSASVEVGYHPFNPLMIRLLAPLFGGDLEQAGFADSILFGVMGVLGIFLLGREIFGEHEGLLAALLWALLPNAVHFSSDVLTEGQFMAFWILAAWAGLKALRSRSLPWALAAGALGGLAYETRAEGVGIPLALGAALSVLAWRERRSGGIRRLTQAGALALGFLLLASPYLLLLRGMKGQWMLSPTKSVSNLLTLRSTVWTSVPRDPRPREDIRTPDPTQTVPPVPHKGAALLDALTDGFRTVIWVIPFALWALWQCRPWGPGGRFLLGLALLYAGVLLSLFLTAGYISQRHFLTLAAIVVLWASAAPVLLERRRLLFLVSLALIVQTCLPLPLREDKRYRREFGQWLALSLPAGDEVATLQGPEIPYYARRAGVDWAADPPRHMDHIRERQVLVLDREADGAWVARASANPFLKEVRLKSPFDTQFALFRKAGP